MQDAVHCSLGSAACGPSGGSGACPLGQPLVDQLVEKLKAAAKAGADERVYVRGSKAVNYGRVAEVMSLVTGAGFKKVALVTEPDRK